MYIPPLLLLAPEFASDYAEEQGLIFDTICLRKCEELDDIITEIVIGPIYSYFDGNGDGDGDGESCGDADGDGDGRSNGLSFGDGSGSGADVEGSSISCGYGNGAIENLKCKYPIYRG